jgi:DNA-binding transcriptional MerR regulator
MHTVGDLAQLAGVTVRTLHHYDEIGLLRPSGRTDSGYRLYAHDDLERLQEILVWRQLGFALPEIAALIDDSDPDRDRLSALRHQRELVGRESERLAATARALDAAITAHELGTTQKEEAMFEDFDPSAYEAEVRERWGDTEAHRESGRRSAGYGEAEWAEVKAESDAVEADFARLLAAGEPADGEAARAVAERHRQHIAQWFYDLSPQMHRQLGEMYVADPRFGAHYDQRAAGLAAYVGAAIAANADAQPQTATRR